MQNMCGEPPPELASEPETEGSGVMDRDAVVEECAAWHDNQAKTLRDMTFRPNPEVDGGIMDTLRLDRADEHDGYAAAIRALKSGAVMSPAAVVTRECVIKVIWQESRLREMLLTHDGCVVLADAILALLRPTHIGEDGG